MGNSRRLTIPPGKIQTVYGRPCQVKENCSSWSSQNWYREKGISRVNSCVPIAGTVLICSSKNSTSGKQLRLEPSPNYAHNNPYNLIMVHSHAPRAI